MPVLNLSLLVASIAVDQLEASRGQTSKAALDAAREVLVFLAVVLEEAPEAEALRDLAVPDRSAHTVGTMEAGMRRGREAAAMLGRDREARGLPITLLRPGVDVPASRSQVWICLPVGGMMEIRARFRMG